MPRAKDTEIKLVGKRGQISLGKSYAGQALRVERRRDGSITLTPLRPPQNQFWTLAEPHRSRVRRGLAWASTTKPSETNVDVFVTQAPRAVSCSRGRRR